MITPREPWRAIAPLLAATVVLQSVVVLVPHEHASETVLGVPALLHLEGPADQPEVSPVRQRLAGATCLACVVNSSTAALPVPDTA